MAVADPGALELYRLRAWRTWLLVVVALGQGLQYMAVPDRALTTQAYALLEPLGRVGWRVFAALLIVCAALLVPRPFRRFGHLLGAALYLLLFWATVLHGFWPALAVLAGGLHCGEFWLWRRSVVRGG